MTGYWMSQISYQAPTLLVCLVAFVLAVMNMSRAKVPCILALIGACLLVATAIGVAVIQGILIEGRANPGNNAIDTTRLMSIVGIVGSCLRAVSLGFWVAAIFAGRSSDAEQGYPDAAAYRRDR